MKARVYLFSVLSVLSTTALFADDIKAPVYVSVSSVLERISPKDDIVPTSKYNLSLSAHAFSAPHKLCSQTRLDIRKVCNDHRLYPEADAKLIVEQENKIASNGTIFSTSKISKAFWEMKEISDRHVACIAKQIREIDHFEKEYSHLPEYQEISKRVSARSINLVHSNVGLSDKEMGNLTYLDHKKLNIGVIFDAEKRECNITKKEGLLAYYQELLAKDLMKSAISTARAAALDSIDKLQKDIADAERAPKSRQIVMSVENNGTVVTESR